jgi:hypothetical protein
MSDGLEIEYSDFNPENATLNGDQLPQVVGIVIGGISSVLEVSNTRVLANPMQRIKSTRLTVIKQWRAAIDF